MDHIDLQKFIVEKDSNTGRPRCDAEKLLRITLFGFMENGYVSLRLLQKLCKTDIRYIWMLDEMPAPSFATFGNFIRNNLTGTIEDIFSEINQYIFQQEQVELEHVYIDGTKIEANANKYTWVWKKSCIRNRDKVFEKLTLLIKEMNEAAAFLKVRFEERTEYAIEQVESIRDRYAELYNIVPEQIPTGSGHRKSPEQRIYQKICEYLNRLKNMRNILKSAASTGTVTQNLIMMQPLCVSRGITWEMISCFRHIICRLL